jgi:hypothetical protein
MRTEIFACKQPREGYYKDDMGLFGWSFTSFQLLKIDEAPVILIYPFLGVLKTAKADMPKILFTNSWTSTSSRSAMGLTRSSAVKSYYRTSKWPHDETISYDTLRDDSRLNTVTNMLHCFSLIGCLIQVQLISEAFCAETSVIHLALSIESHSRVSAEKVQMIQTPIRKCPALIELYASKALVPFR